jgi:hypothetical protein
MAWRVSKIEIAGLATLVLSGVAVGCLLYSIW